MDKQHSKSIVFVFLIALICLLTVLMLPPGPSRQKVVILQRPFQHAGLNLYRAAFSDPIISDKDGKNASNVVLFESHQLLEPAHAPLAAIKTQGKGRYRHFGNAIEFSTSDNSDPNKNGREYAAVYDGKWMPVGVYILLEFIGIFLLMFLVNRMVRGHLAKKAGLQKAVNALVALLFTFALVQFVFWTLTMDKLADMGQTARLIYASEFEDAKVALPKTMTTFYSPHHYMNYSLNPEAEFDGKRQFDEKWLIRRTEPIRPKKDVALRILAIGGSTTFGDGVFEEDKTWVRQMERLAREKYGTGVDVVNGGVGGYTVLENIIHYVTLLHRLEPDVVLLVEGVNDVFPRLYGEVNTDYSNYRIPFKQGAGTMPKVNNALAPFFPYRYFVLTKQISKVQNQHLFSLVNKPMLSLDEWKKALQENKPETYADHLVRFVKILQADGVKIAIIPQLALTRANNKADEIFNLGVYEHNEVNRQVAKSFEIPYAQDAASDKIFSLADLSDNVHFNEAGSEKLASLLLKFCEENGLFDKLDTAK